MKIVQITDTHLFTDDAEEIFGVKSNSKFKEVLAKIIQEDLHDTDLIFLTGDISQDETAESYRKIADLLSPLNIPIYWIPGNHDDLLQLETVLKNAKNFNRKPSLSTAHWHFIFLNTKQDDSGKGYLTLSELELLKNEISVAPKNKKLAIIMHHHPAPVNTPLIDYYILQNRDEFWNIIDKTKVDLIICGHVHGDYRFKFNNVMIESSPATCLQWQKGTTDLAIDLKIGYKVYHFHSEGYEAVAKLW